MTRKLYTQTRAKLEQELAKAKSAVQVLTDKIKALDIVYHEILNAPSDDAAADNPEAVDDRPALPFLARSTIGELVHNVALGMRNEFDVPAVIREMQMRHPEIPSEQINRSTVSGRLRRMAADGELHVVHEGRGPNPTVYRVRGETASDTDVCTNEKAALAGG